VTLWQIAKPGYPGTRMKIFRLLPVLALALVAGGCVTSKNPIGQTAGFKPDPALVGVWRTRVRKDDPVITVYVLPKKDGGMTALAIGLPNKKDEGGWETFDLRVAALGPYHYMSGREGLDNGVPSKDRSGYTLLLYRLSGADTLTLYQLDTQKIGAVVDSGKLAGKVRKSDPKKSQWQSVSITADPASLDAFMKKPESAILFSAKFLVLHRQKPPQ
jgi:hypothetical protein